MPDPAAEEQQLKLRAMRRLAIALALIAAAVVSLAVLDRYYSGSDQAQTAKAPPNEPPAIAALPPPKPIAPPPASDEAVPPPPSVDEADTSSPPPADAHGAESAAGAKARPGASGEVGTVAKAQPAAPALPAATAAAPSLAPNAGFVIQLGMFTSAENAQALLERLRSQGVPADLETRVVVGPFRDRAEADAARRKLEASGVGGVIAQRK